MKKKIIVFTIILIVLTINFISIMMPKVEGTVEEGKFNAEELPYNIRITKIVTGNVGLYSRNTMALDEDGELWRWEYPPRKRIFPELNGRKIIDLAAGYRRSFLYNR